jgi:UPF0716 family protein affecting phage T7 exclusion
VPRHELPDLDTEFWCELVEEMEFGEEIGKTLVTSVLDFVACLALCIPGD